MTAFPGDGPAENAARWRADIVLLLCRTIAALILIPEIALTISRVQAGLLVNAVVGLILYALLVGAAISSRVATGWRVTIMLIILATMAFNIIASRGLGLNVGVVAGTFALLTLLARGRAAAALAAGAWVAVLAATASATAAGSLGVIPERGVRQVLTSIALWMTVTTMGVVALSSVIARLEEGLKSTDDLERRLRSEARERLALTERMVFEEETLRGNLARELHDDIGQRLTAIKITLETARVHRQDRLMAACRESARLIQELVRDMSASTNLRPAVIEEGGISVAIRTLVRDEASRAGMTAVVDIPDPLAMRDEARMPCYRIVQEALTNSIRHARARSIVVRGERVLDGVALMVRDDGVGFDVEAARRLGVDGERLGLVGMRERADAIGADLEIVSSPGAGTEIRLLIPDEGAA